MRHGAILAILMSLGAFAGPSCLAADEAVAPTEAKKSADKPAADSKAEAAARIGEEYDLQKLLADTLDQVERNYVTDISRRELMEAAIHGVLSKLDQYSNYINPDELGDFKTSVDSQFGGIGIQIEFTRTGRPVVASPLVGSPAYRAGMQAGDVIVEIDSKPTDNLHAIDEVVTRLKGEPGTKVTLTTLRPGSSDRKTFTIEREVIRLDTVLGDRHKDDDSWDFMLDRERKIGYVRITGFSRDTEHDLVQALDELKRDGMRGLILDLRFNPGGLLSSAIAVSDLFVAKGRIVSTEGRNTKPRTWDAQQEGTYEGFPMVVLVNRYSASASEIVSACLQDHKRAVVIGERTWGKGSVQNVIELEGGKSALKLTTASYVRPSGKNIHRFPNAKDSDDWGVLPDSGYELKLDNVEQLQLMEQRRNRDILQVNHYGGAADEAAKKTTTNTEKKTSDDKGDEKTRKPATSDNGTPPDGAAETPRNGRQRGAAFVDRQLKKAIDFLSTEMAKTN